MIFLFILIFLFYVYFIFSYIKFIIKAVIGLQIARRTQPYQQKPTHPKRRILVIGDSSAVGVGAEDPSQSFAGYLGAQYPDAEVINRGVNGAKVRDLIPFLKSHAQERYDLLMIHIGANDIVWFTPLNELELDLATVIGLAKPLAKDVVIMSCGDAGTARIFPYGIRWMFTIRTKQVRTIFLRIATYFHVHYVDLYLRHRVDPFYQEHTIYYSQDDFHPSGAGYRFWYQDIAEALWSLPGWEENEK